MKYVLIKIINEKDDKELKLNWQFRLPISNFPELIPYLSQYWHYPKKGRPKKSSTPNKQIKITI